MKDNNRLYSGFFTLLIVPFIIGGLLGAGVFFGGYKGYQSYQKHKNYNVDTIWSASAFIEQFQKNFEGLNLRDNINRIKSNFKEKNPEFADKYFKDSYKEVRSLDGRLKKIRPGNDFEAKEIHRLRDQLREIISFIDLWQSIE
jgi:hypothetical protein